MTVLAIGLSNLPHLLTGPIGGVLADRMDRARLLAAIFACKALVLTTFALVVIVGAVHVWQIFVFVLMMGMLQSSAFPARQSIVSSVVPPDYLVNAFALMLLTSSSLQLTLPTITGFSIKLQGSAPTLLVGAALYIMAAIPAAMLRLPASDKINMTSRSFLSDLAAGARYVWHQPVLLPIVLLSGGVYIFVVPTVHGLLPVYASEVFDVGPVGLGLMGSALGVGAFLAGVLLASVPTLHHKGRFMIGSLALSVAAAVALSQSSSILLALPLIALVNVGFDGFAMVRTASIQIVAPNEMRGRATAVNSMATGLSPLGGVALGGAAQLLGASHATLIGAALMALCLLLVAYRYRELWRFG